MNRGKVNSGNDAYNPEQLSSTVLDGKYRIGPIVGRGGMGTVFAGTRLADGLDVAIKVMHPRCAASPAEVERFDRECAVLGELDHPNISALYDVGDTPDDLRT